MAAYGGAVYMWGGEVELFGPTTFLDNRATRTGGAVSLFTSSSMRVSGPLCAQGNSATSGNQGKLGAGFAYVFDNCTLIFMETSNAALANNGPQSVVTTAGGNITTQGIGRWASQEYNITGTIGECSTSFVANTSTSCDACGADRPWDATACSCSKVRQQLRWWPVVQYAEAVRGYRIRIHVCCSSSRPALAPKPHQLGSLINVAASDQLDKLTHASCCRGQWQLLQDPQDVVGTRRDECIAVAVHC